MDRREPALTILDASALGTVLLPDESTDLQDQVGAVLLHGATVPPHFHVEVASLLLRAIRRGRVSNENRTEVIATAQILLKNVVISPQPPTASIIYLAEQHGLSAYDASYLWLAIKESAPLLTVDGPLQRVARKIGVAA